MLVLAVSFASSALADVTKPDEKPGFMRRIFGGGEAPQPPAPPAPEEVKEAPKAKPATPGPKPKVTTIKPKSSGSTSKSSSSKTSEVQKTPETKKAPATAPEKKGDGEFGQDDDDKQTAETKPVAAPSTLRGEPSHPLPPSQQGSGWKLIKVNGRDYVTADSIHQFYRFSSYKLDGTHVWLRSNNLILKAQVGSQEMLINNIKFILSFPVLESGGRPLFSRLDLCKLIDPVLRPTYISDAEPFDTVVIDAGHGGHDAGARGVYGYEKDFALKMAFSVKDSLEKKGFRVILTRSTDTFITLSGRVAIANATPRSIFLSLHFNSGGSAASGIETFALTPQGSAASLERGGGYNANGLTGNSHDSANIALATAVHAMVISRFKFVDRGIKRAQWSVLTGCKRPGILFEGGFVTNGNECRLIASDTYRQSVSGAIADAVVNYRTALRGAITNRR
jgi:N-acetylmuramoyl-L-alanine amidase